MKLFSVFDKQVGAFMPLFPARATGEALRMITDAMNDPNSQLGRHPLDFALYECCDWDESTAEFQTTAEHPRKVLDLSELKEKGG
nr:MAG: nonstructural protein [Microvirus sp.]